MTKAKNTTVDELAKEANKDLEETLILLWDGGLNSIDGPYSDLSGKSVDLARKILNLPSRNELTSLKYWQDYFGLEGDEFKEFLDSLGIKINSNMKRTPKGALKILQKESQQSSTYSKTQESHMNETKPKPQQQPFKWEQIGSECESHMLDYDEVLEIHNTLVRDFAASEDPIDPPGLRDENLLKSAISRPLVSMWSEPKYKTCQMAAAALMHSIIHNHAFHNGNKRTALVSTLVFLDRNGIIVICSDDELFKFVLQTAQHSLIKERDSFFADREVMVIARWIYDNSRATEKGERPLPFRVLRRILTGYGCDMDTGSHGSKMNIYRTVEKRRLLGGTKKIQLKTQIYYGGEGKEVDKNTISKLRDALHLDSANGVDSLAFYGKTPFTVDDIIVRHSNLLKRLAKL